MSAFATIPDDGQPLRVVLVGVGEMGRVWVEALENCPLVSLVGVVDLNDAAASAVSDQLGRPLAVGADVVQVASASRGQAVVNVTVPAAHLPVTTAALFAGLPVLGEKPLAATVAQGLSLAAAAEVSGQLFMVSQNRRYNPQVVAFREQLAGLGGLSVLSVQLFRSPHFGGFRDVMDHPLLLDMAIHQFDLARLFCGAEPVAVYCEEFNPPWSWMAGDVGAAAVFEMTGGGRFVFSGCWCSPGYETSWNGSWRANGQFGSAHWNGDDAPEVDPGGLAVAGGLDERSSSGIDGTLREFVHALRTGREPDGEVHRNLPSLAMVEAAVASSVSGRRVLFAEVMASALETALAVETRPEVAAVLRRGRSRTPR